MLEKEKEPLLKKHVIPIQQTMKDTNATILAIAPEDQPVLVIKVEDTGGPRTQSMEDTSDFYAYSASATTLSRCSTYSTILSRATCHGVDEVRHEMRESQEIESIPIALGCAGVLLGGAVGKNTLGAKMAVPVAAYFGGGLFAGTYALFSLAGAAICCSHCAKNCCGECQSQAQEPLMPRPR